MLAEPRWVPCAACRTLRETSYVAAPCSSTAATEGEMNLPVAISRPRRSGIDLQQFCKHVGHKRPVEFTPSDGRIPFSAGACVLAAGGIVLAPTVEAADADRLSQVQDVVARHLFDLRSAHR
jgi:hypothetical protein